MALTLTPRQYTSDAPTGLTVTAVGALGALISWDPVEPGDKVEVWWNSTNSSGTATKIATTHDKVYVDKDFNAADAGTNYYWLKRIQPNGQVSSFTSSANATVKSLSYTSGWVGISGASGSGSVSTWGSYVDWFTFGFDYTPTTTDELFASGTFAITSWSPTLASGEDVTLDLRFLIRNETDGTTVNTIDCVNVWKESYTKTYYTCPWFPMFISSGGSITAGKQYDVKVQYKFTRTGTPSMSIGYATHSNMAAMYN